VASANYRDWEAMLEGYHKLYGSKTQINRPNQSPNSKNRCRWSGTACHTNRSTRLLKASQYDWRHAQKLAMNNLSTQDGCQTSDKVLTVLFHWRCLPCFGAKVFQRAKIAKWSR